MNRIVDTKYGKIEGFEENGLIKYLGIPYAKKLDNDLKWKRAKECEPWDGIFKADHYGDVAPQYNTDKWQGSLDCLSINVVRPFEGENLPVFVWIHGGGFSIGGCNDTLYAGEEFAKDGCIYVSFQYRLSVLGFYEFCTYPGCQDFETNRGLSDMIMALKWIHENIQKFGGNPKNVTIAGESAGGTAATTLMAVPSVEGYFQKVIAESSLCELVDTVESQRRNVNLFIEGMGWNQDDENLAERIRATDDYELVKGHLYQEAHAQYKYPGILGAGPVIDDLLPKRPMDAVNDGASKSVKLIIGTNLNEGTMFVRPEATTFPNSWDMIEDCLKQNGLADKFEAFKKIYSDFEMEGKYGSAFVKFATDTGWEVPSIRFATAHSKWNDTYMYRFEYLSGFAKKTGMLVSHAFELPCVFAVRDHEFSNMFFEGESDEDIQRIIEAVHSSWINFAKIGEPDITWKTFNGNLSPVRVFDHECRTENMDRTKLINIWGNTVFYKE